MKADEVTYNLIPFLWGFSNNVSTDASLCTGRECGGAVGKSLSTMSIQAWICPFCTKLKMEHLITYRQFFLMRHVATCWHGLGGSLKLVSNSLLQRWHLPLCPVQLESIPDGVKGVFCPCIRIPGTWEAATLRLTNMTRVGDVVSEWPAWQTIPMRVQCHNLRSVDWKKKSTTWKVENYVGLKFFTYLCINVLAALGLGCCSWHNSSSGEEHGPWCNRAQ